MTALSHLVRHRKLPLVWAGALSALAILGFFRTLTRAEFALASAAIIPVYVVAWAGGFRQGLMAAVIAALMWLISGWLVLPATASHWIVLLNGCARLLVYFCVAALTARVRTLLLREAEAARRDGLTALLNRRAFREIGRHEVFRSSRYEHPLAVVFIDLDHFKRLNDGRGHATGDRALCAVASALTGALRKTDQVARLGGDEFGVILPEIDQVGTSAAADKLAAAVALALGEFPPVSASIGVAWFERAGQNFEALLNEADALMYQIKAAGVGGVRVRHFPNREVPDEPSEGLLPSPIATRISIGENS